MPRIAPLALAGAALVLAIAACAGGTASTEQPTAPATTATPSTPSDPPAASPTVTATSPTAITIDKFEFVPARLTVHVGDTVTWTNEENSFHTVTSGTPDSRTGLFDSGEFDTRETFEYTFAEAGTYAFFCDRHEFMRGEVTVLP